LIELNREKIDKLGFCKYKMKLEQMVCKAEEIYRKADERINIFKSLFKEVETTTSYKKTFYT
jgi:hypothetical protein